MVGIPIELNAGSIRGKECPWIHGVLRKQSRKRPLFPGNLALLADRITERNPPTRTIPPGRRNFLVTEAMEERCCKSGISFLGMPENQGFRTRDEVANTSNRMSLIFNVSLSRRRRAFPATCVPWKLGPINQARNRVAAISRGAPTRVEIAELLQVKNDQSLYILAPIQTICFNSLQFHLKVFMLSGLRSLGRWKQVFLSLESVKAVLF